MLSSLAQRVILFFYFVLVCATSPAQTKHLKAYSVYQGDTINRIDNSGLKQGPWMYFGKDKRGLKNKLLKHNAVTEEGSYGNDKKNGTWKTYHTNTGRLKSEMVFMNGLASGKASIYNEKGKLKEEGIMENNSWVGEYHVYDEKGNKLIKKAWKNNIPLNSYLTFIGVLTKTGKPLEGVTISIEKNDLETDRIHSSKTGMFTVLLELNNEYILHFFKAGFSKQSLIINTDVGSFKDTSIYELKDWSIEMYDNMASSATNEIFGFLLNKPSDKIYFNKKKKAFTADGSYAHLFKKQINDISETTKILLTAAADDNKKLEIENLRIESEKKLKEIELLRKSKELQDAELNRKESELLAQKLEAEKKEQSLSLLEKERQIKELKFKEQESRLIKQQLDAERKAREIEHLNMAKKLQEIELNERESKLSKTTSELDKETKESKIKEKEIGILNRENDIQEKELKQKQAIIFFVVGGLFLIVVFSFFLYRSFSQKKKANIVLERQAEEISRQKNEIEEKSRVIEIKNIETGQSITYAQRIQQAILPPLNVIKEVFPESFVLYKSKDIVSGDFYFFEKPDMKEREQGGITSPIIFAAVDCTGHGVPGAFMSMIGTEKLNDAVKKSAEPGRILQLLNNGVKTALRQSDSDQSTRDGMDIALCTFELSRNKLHYAGANRPLWIIRKNKQDLEEIKPTKNSIAGYTVYGDVFNQHEIELNTGDTFYFFTDGFADQFGGKNKKKLMTKRFKEILIQIQPKTMTEQHVYLERFMEDWKGDCEQVDDILVIGVRIAAN